MHHLNSARSSARLRVVVAGLCGSLLLGACGGVGSDIFEEATPLPTLTASADPSTTASDGPDAAEPDDSEATDSEPGQTPSESETSSTPRPAMDDFGRVGSNGKAMLQAGIPRLIIEVDHQAGAEPTQSALDLLASSLRDVADKPAGISFAGGNSFASDRTEWTSANLREAAAANRTNYSGGDTAVVYVLYVRGGFFSDGQQTNALGVTYNASEVGMFPNRWAGAGGLLGSDTQVERAVAVHELGHLLGLVNLTYTSNIDHEDPEHRGHSRSEGSVMFYAIESTLIGQLLTGPPSERFDSADLEDLQGLKDGRY